MASDVRAHIRKCERCVRARVSEPVPKVPMRYLMAFRPLEVLAVDFVKVDRGRGGYEYVLVMTDASLLPPLSHLRACNQPPRRPLCDCFEHVHKFTATMASMAMSEPPVYHLRTT